MLNLKNYQSVLVCIALILSFFLTFAGINVSHAQDVIPVKTLSKLPALTNFSISRDGDYLVGLTSQPGDDKLSLTVWDPRDLSIPPKFTKPDRDVEFVAAQALKAGKILVFARTKWTGALAGCGEGKSIGSTKTYLSKIFVTDTEFSGFSEPFAGNNNSRDMSEYERICGEMLGTGSIAADLPLDPENVIISNKSGLFANATNYVKYNLKTGSSEILFKNRGFDSIGLLDPRTGDVLTKSGADYSSGRYKDQRLIVDENGSFKVHDKLTSDSKDRHSISLLGKNELTGKYYVRTNQFSDKSRIYEYDSVKEEYADEPLITNADFNINSLITSDNEADFGTVLGYSVSGLFSQAVWFDDDLRNLQKTFENYFPNKQVSFSSWSNDRKKVVITVQSDSTPPTYYLYSKGEPLKKLGSAYPELEKNNLVDTKLIYYTARDGLKIPGLLTMPAGWQAGDKAPPAVIHPHGGPWARDEGSWDPSGWVPFLTSRGFAVLRPQYRGSLGWGRELWLAGDAEWGQKMQDDKDDGAAWMVDQGYADEDKIAIFGYSYGGFAAFSAATRSNSPYACAIGGAGVSDLTKLGRSWSGNPVQRAYQGKTVKGTDPLKNTDNAEIPLLIFHGDRDVRVPMFHAKDLHRKMKRKVKSKLVVIKDMPHSLPWTPKMQTQKLTAIENFLENDCF